MEIFPDLRMNLRNGSGGEGLVGIEYPREILYSSEARILWKEGENLFSYVLNWSRDMEINFPVCENSFFSCVNLIIGLFFSSGS